MSFYKLDTDIEALSWRISEVSGKKRSEVLARLLKVEALRLGIPVTPGVKQAAPASIHRLRRAQ
jgi:hypothetical protein